MAHIPHRGSIESNKVVSCFLYIGNFISGLIPGLLVGLGMKIFLPSRVFISAARHFLLLHFKGAPASAFLVANLFISSAGA